MLLSFGVSPISALFILRPPAVDDIHQLLSSGVKRFIFAGPEAAAWADIFIAITAEKRALGDPQEEAQSMIFIEENILEIIKIIQGVSDETVSPPVLVF